MRSKKIILVVLLVILAIPCVQAEDAQEWYTKGQNAALAGNYADALTYYNNALVLEKNYAAAIAGKAAALNGLGKYSDAVALSEQALAIKSSDPNALNARAYGLFKLGRYEESVSAYDNLFNVQTNRVDAYCNQGYAYLMLNRSEAAIQSYERCTAIDPLNLESWNRKGIALMNLGRYEDALKAFDHATSITIKNATVWNNKGLAYVNLEKPQDALQCFNKALGIDPNFTEAKTNKESVMGKQQVYTIYGTSTPAVTISRIGTFYTTPTPVPVSPEITTAGPGVNSEVTTIETVGTTPVQKKTTYSPVSPVAEFGAVIVVSGIVIALNRQKK
jgi:tetratricopeptide (TPR) repeat protein